MVNLTSFVFSTMISTFPCIIAIARTSSIILDKSRGSKTVERKKSNFVNSCGYIMLKYAPSISDLSRILSNVVFFWHFRCVYIIFFQYVDGIYHLYWFYINQCLHPWNESHLVMVNNLSKFAYFIFRFYSLLKHST